TRVRRLVGLDSEAKKRRNMLMPTAAALLDRIGRPGDLSLGTARPEPLGRLPTGLAVLDEALGGGLPRGRIAELAGAPSTGRAGLAGAIAAAATRAAERTRATLRVVALRRAAGTFAALGLELGARRVRWSGGPGRLVLREGIDARVTVARSRIGRPGQALVVRQACA